MAATDDPQATPATPHTLEFVGDVSLGITVEFGRAEITIRKLLQLNVGSVLELDGHQGDSLTIRIHGNACAKGEVVAVNDHYGIRITEVLDPKSSS